MQVDGQLDLDFQYLAVYLVRRVHQVHSTALRSIFVAEGIAETQWYALMAISGKRVKTAADLARDLVYDKGAMTRLVDYLESRGWVQRNRASDDRRRIDLILTPKGAALALQCQAQVIELYRRAFSDWPRDEVEVLVGSMFRLCETLESINTSRDAA